MGNPSLSEFIEESLVEIVGGIQSAQNRMKQKLHHCQPIAPATVGGEAVHRECVITFDIAVMTSNTASVKAGASGKFAINVLSGSIDGTIQSSKEFANKIKFDVPYYPQSLY